MKRSILTVEIRDEQDVVLTRQRARQIATAVGLDAQDRTRLAAAVSEIARNAFRYARGGRAEFSVETGASPMLHVRISDTGPGIADLQAVLDGTRANGTGVGIAGSRRLTDHFDIESGPGGTIVTLGRRIPARTGNSQALQTAAVAELAPPGPLNPIDEAEQQNRELLHALDALRNRQIEVERLNSELAETNRGVLALYAELDEKAQELRKVSDLKTRFLSNMTHELRTPLNSIIMLARMMNSERDGPLGPEYKKQAEFISQSAETLLELVNDLLDLAKIEAGKVDIRATEFTADELLSGLRGMFRAMGGGRDVALIFDPVRDEIIMHSDAPKISQILRNLISNALKFTERGEVRVSAELRGDQVAFAVSDTGIGISPEGQKRLFQDFAQLRDEYRKGIKGTGLGLSISRQLADLLGGRIELRSEVGVGSTFTVILPQRFSVAADKATVADKATAAEAVTSEAAAAARDSANASNPRENQRV